MILISACLLGKKCRFDGRGLEGPPAFHDWVEKGLALAICPEELGGLSIPRLPAELVGGDGKAVLLGRAKVLRSDGIDLTAAFLKGANEALRLALASGAKTAILKAHSPSCGCRSIYDGSFEGVVVSGMGVTAALFAASGIAVFDEENREEIALAMRQKNES
ncbi:MAG TPA: DUF523 domain-containing protein [Cyanobacteria bacterium UBA8530]|nr:DUF523 domain-containing protein [Cyanobacteria bacterium UBA8530]